MPLSFPSTRPSRSSPVSPQRIFATIPSWQACNWGRNDFARGSLFRKNQISNYECGLIWANEYFLQFFDFENFIGDSETALIGPFPVVITEEIGRQYFSDTPQLDDIIELRWNGAFYPLEITGINSRIAWIHAHSLKLMKKERQGAKVSKKYESAKRPYQRVLLS